MRHQQSAISKKHEHIGVGAHSMHILYYSLVATYLYECVCFLRSQCIILPFREKKKFRLYDGDLELGEAIILKLTRERKIIHWERKKIHTP